MKKTIIFFILIISVATFSQQDYIAPTKNSKFDCTILELKKSKVVCEIGSKKITKDIGSLNDMFIADESKVKTPLNLKIAKPKKGYAHVYFFRPYVYLNSALGCKIFYKGNKFINIKTNSYFLHKIKAGEKHTYIRKKIGKNNIVEIDAKDGKVYFVRAALGGVTELNTGTNSSHLYGADRYIYLDNSKMAKYFVLSMKKESKQY